MEYLIISLTAFTASLVTFFTGFGLGTILLPAFIIFFPVESAIALTAAVHLINNLFKVLLVGKHASKHVVLHFGLPALVAALVGADLLVRLAALPAVATMTIGGRLCRIMPVKLLVALLMCAFSLLEMSGSLKSLKMPPRYLVAGGAVSGFFGGLSGHQGALRGLFLVKAGLSAEQFVGTSCVIATLVDVARLAVYVPSWSTARLFGQEALVGLAVVSALAGSLLGSRLLKKASYRVIEVAASLLVLIISVGLATGLL
ncbi:MAG TPA: sulfite exporter TauE/SafE family protein [Candidatus Obscuribacterales bacterium]